MTGGLLEDGAPFPDASPPDGQPAMAAAKTIIKVRMLMLRIAEPIQCAHVAENSHFRLLPKSKKYAMPFRLPFVVRIGMGWNAAAGRIRYTVVNKQ